MKYTGERIIPQVPDCGPGTLLYETHVARYRFAATYVRGQVVLDVACGVGYGARLLGDGGAVSVVGGDIAPEAVRYAARFYGARGVTFAAMSAEKLPFATESLDCVVSFETLEHVPDARQFVTEVHRVLRNGGMFLVSTPNSATYGRAQEVPDNPFHTREFTYEELRELLASRFGHIDAFAQRAQVRESHLALSVDYWSRWLRSLDVLGLRRRLIPRFLKTRLETVADAYDRDPSVQRLRADRKPLFFIAVARKVLS